MGKRGLRFGTKDIVIALTLVGAGAYGTWIALHARGGLGVEWTDGSRVYAELEDVRYAVWEDPRPIAGEANSEEAEGRSAMSPDGRVMVFAVGERGLGADLFVADVVDGAVLEPRPLYAVNSAFDELAPAFGHDALYFASDRAGESFGLDLWRAPYANGELGDPEPVRGGLNTAFDETDPLPLPGTDELLFASNRERGLRDDFDLFRATPELGAETETWAVTPVHTLSSPFDEREPAVTADGRVLVFASDRAGSRGGFDLYRSLRDGGDWLPPTQLDGLNSTADERGPLLSQDGFSLTFARNGVVETATGDTAPAASSDLFRARSRELFRLPPRAITLTDILILALLLLLALLALLAKRWRGMEILYKCILASCLVHLLILWYLQHVHPESEPAVLAGEDRLFRVRVERMGELASGADTERGGTLDAERSMLDPEVTPAELARDGRARELVAASPAARSLERAEHQEAQPGRQGHEPTPTAPRDEAVVQLNDAAAPFARKDGSAPALTLAAGPTHSAPAASAGASPERGDTPETESLQASARHQSMARGDRPAEALPAPSEFVAAPSQRATAGGETLALHQPDEAFDKNAGEVAGLALPAVASHEAPARDAQGPERADGASPTAVNAIAGDDPLPRETGQLTAAAAPAREEPALPTRRGAPAIEPTRARSAPELAFVDLKPDELRPQAGAAVEPPRFDATSVVEASLTREPPRTPNATPAMPSPTRFQPDRDRLPDRAPERRAIEVADAPMPEEVALPTRLDHTPYRNRFGAEKQAALELYGGTEETEAAVARGLDYLASIQDEEGYWGSTRDYHEKYRHVLVGKTALCLLAFLGAGHTPEADTEHADVSRRAIALLLGVQDPRTGHFGDTSAYSHGIATYALAECFALTQDESLRAPLERAVARIVSQQQHTRDPRTNGGWGYFYPDGAVWNRDRWPRVSVTAWQVMALESARLGGLTVPDAVFDDARAYLANAWDPEMELYRYSQDPGRLRSGWPTLPASTPAAVFALSLLGVENDDPLMVDARREILERAPRRYARASDDAFIHRAAGNLYFWYYATLSTFRIGGRDWERWNAALKETLLDGQDADGSWRPISVYSEFAGDDDRDRSYTTAMCVLSLEVYYRYFTPLLEVR